MKKLIILSILLIVSSLSIGTQIQVSSAQNGLDTLKGPENETATFTLENKSDRNIQATTRWGAGKNDEDSKIIGKGLQAELHCPGKSAAIQISFVYKNKQVTKTLHWIVLPKEKIVIKNYHLKLTRKERKLFIY